MGFRVGNEEGGLHYAVVVDNDNSQSSGIVTIIPLSSIKSDDDKSKYDVPLGNELYNKIKNKATNLSDYCDNEIERLETVLKECKSTENVSELISQKVQKCIQDIQDLKNKIGRFKKINKEINKMKLGTKALIGQIITISKMRIFDPKNDGDVLSGIKISPNNLELITLKMKELYYFMLTKK